MLSDTKIIGLTGSIATGKSAVADILTKQGIAVLDADAATKQLSAPGGEAYEAIIKKFPEVVGQDGNIDKKKLAEVVFHDKVKLDGLEGIIHPKIKKMREEFYRAARQRGDKVVFIMVPLLFEKSIDKECHETWVVVCNVENQTARALQRPNMTKELLEKIRASQMSEDEKTKRADVVIENNGNLQDLTNKVLAHLKQATS